MFEFHANLCLRESTHEFPQPLPDNVRVIHLVVVLFEFLANLLPRESTLEFPQPLPDNVRVML